MSLRVVLHETNGLESETAKLGICKAKAATELLNPCVSQ